MSNRSGHIGTVHYESETESLKKKGRKRSNSPTRLKPKKMLIESTPALSIAPGNDLYTRYEPKMTTLFS